MGKDVLEVLQSVEEAIHYLSGIRDDIKAGTYSPEAAAADVFHLENGGYDFFSALEWYAEGMEEAGE